MALATKHRPATIDQVVGNEDMLRSLSSVLNKPHEDIPHAFLFIGPPGCGKTTLGRITASTLGCSEFNMHEVDTTLYRKTNDIEDIISQVHLTPWNGGIQVWLLDEAHQIGTGGDSEKNKAQNALLKILEEPPPSTYFILCTTNPEMLLSTIRSRCSTFEVQALSPSIIVKFLQSVSRSERKRVPVDVLEQIASDCLGSCRNALQILDQVIDLEPAEMMVMAQQTATKQNQIVDLCRALFAKEKWKVITEILKGLEKESPESVRLGVRGYCANILLSGKDAPQAYVVMDCFRNPFYTDGRSCLIQASYEAVESMK